MLSECELPFLTSERGPEEETVRWWHLRVLAASSALTPTPSPGTAGGTRGSLLRRQAQQKAPQGQAVRLGSGTANVHTKGQVAFVSPAAGRSGSTAQFQEPATPTLPRHPFFQQGQSVWLLAPTALAPPQCAFSLGIQRVSCCTR